MFFSVLFVALVSGIVCFEETKYMYELKLLDSCRLTDELVFKKINGLKNTFIWCHDIGVLSSTDYLHSFCPTLDSFYELKNETKSLLTNIISATIVIGFPIRKTIQTNSKSKNTSFLIKNHSHTPILAEEWIRKHLMGITLNSSDQYNIIDRFEHEFNELYNVIEDIDTQRKNHILSSKLSTFLGIYDNVCPQMVFKSCHYIKDRSTFIFEAYNCNENSANSTLIIGIMVCVIPVAYFSIRFYLEKRKHESYTLSRDSFFEKLRSKWYLPMV